MKLLIFTFIVSGLLSLNAFAAKSKDCRKEVETAAVEKLLGKPPRSEFKVLGVNHFGIANKQLGGIRLDLYTVEISDEADGGVMVAFVKQKTCEVHDVVFGTYALDR